MSKSKPKADGSPDPNLPFEDALGQIESIIERIESGEIGLEEALGEYERGVGLIGHCRAKLEKARTRVEDLTRKLEAADEESSSARSGGDGGEAPDSDDDSL